MMAGFATMASYSQTEQGKMFIGGDLNLSGSSSDNEYYLVKSKQTELDFSVTPKFGFFLVDNFALGGEVKFSGKRIVNESEDSKDDLINKTIDYGAGIFIEKYINITDKFKMFANLDLSYTHNSHKYVYQYTYVDGEGLIDTHERKETQHFFNAQITPGFTYFATSHIAIYASFGNIFYQISPYTIDDSYTKEDYKSSSYGISLNPGTFRLGFNYHF